MPCMRFNSRRSSNAALRAPELRYWLELLRRDWDQLTSVEKGDIANLLVRCGCSARALALCISKSPSTLLRCMDLSSMYLDLSDSDQAAIDAGASPTLFFAKWPAEQRLRAREERRPRCENRS